MRKAFLLLFLAASLFQLQAQRPIESSADILQELKKLNIVGNALYVAAHPDDENTRLIAWLENERMVRTAYLSLTRGDGGQNLVGTEKGDAMGVLRTQELLEARKEDGGEQFFSRVDDFGYSKTADETFEKWNKEEVLSDVVYVIRKFKPDVIVTRFPSDSRGGHGHHTASSILANEAFKLAADPNAYPEQLKQVEVWQPKRLLWDVYWWNEEVKNEALEKGGIVTANIGDYNEILGLSYSEIAADSRSQHKSQGFGVARSRGNRLEYLQHTDGDKAENDLFERVDLSWNRVKGGAEIEKQINTLIENYDAAQPAKSVNGLVKLYQSVNEMKANPYQEEKLADIKKLIKATAGIKAEALAENYNYVSGDSIKGQFILLHRSGLEVELTKLDPAIMQNTNHQGLEDNELYEFNFSFRYKNSITHPYWLPYGSYKETLFFAPDLRCKPEAGPIKDFIYTLKIEDEEITFTEPIDYKWSDRVKGELHRDVVISPEATLTPSDKVYTFTAAEAKKINFIAEANRIGKDFTIALKLPEGWKSKPKQISFTPTFVGEQAALSFEIIPPKGSSVGDLEFTLDSKEARAVQRIDYDHIRPQIMFPKAKAKVVKMDIQKTATKIGYIIGSGDEVAQNLSQIGFDVTEIEADKLPVTDLSHFETIVVGIRAYNIHESMKNGNTLLNEFVKNGGTVVVQYNTSRGLKVKEIGPYPFELTRNRVTKEEAEPTLLDEKHPIFNQPNQITDKDFEGWVQERGLYFAGNWDEKYTPIIAWNDPGEEPQKGSILVADYGKGKFIYTGISFFRELPAGVPGAFRLLTNMISYGHE
ncbi:MAG: PIG-L family deacetylase [Vicingaceae bacterium]